GDYSGDTRLLLANRDVDAVERPVVFITCSLCRFVETSLIDDGIDTDCRLARRTVTYDQLTLATANRNHRVNRHDACLHRLCDGAAPNDAWSKFLDRIGDVALYRSLAINWLSERIHNSPEQTFADRYLEKFACSADLVPLLELCV